MSKLVIRDYIDGVTTGEINSPDILVIPSIWDDIEEMRMNYNAELQAVVSANQWGFVYVRVKNNCGETLHNIYVTASFSSESTDGSNRTNALQTVDGMACSVISCLEPGEWAITEKPFILNRAEGITNTIYARACVGNNEFPCNDGSSSESRVGFSVLKGATHGKFQEGFLSIVNYTDFDVQMKISAVIDVSLSGKQVSDVIPSSDFYNKSLNIDLHFDARTFDISVSVPAGFSENLYYLISAPVDTQVDDVSTEQQSLSVVFSY